MGDVPPGRVVRMRSNFEMEYDDLREELALALNAAADSQDAGDLAAIEIGYDDLDGRLLRNADPRFDKLHIALHFWDGWIDSRNHEWLYYEPLSAADWPVLARAIAQQLQGNREIADESVLRHFDWRRRTKRQSVWTRLKGLVVGRRAV
jgi:hypothetical protein